MKLKSRTIKIISTCCFIAAAGIIAVNSYSTIALVNARNQAASGADLFANNCARCHGADGTGGKGPNLTSEKRQSKWKDSDAKLVKKITKGGFIMPSFRKKLRPEEIKAIAGYVRTLKP